MTPSEFALVRSVFGKPAWQIKWDHQVGLRLDFGAPYLHVREPREVDTPKKRVRALFKRLVTLRGSHYLWIAPEAWRLGAQPHRYVEMNRLPKRAIDLKAALRDLPPLIKGYLRLGAYVGQGAVIDRKFGTTDVAIILPVAAINARYIEHFGAIAERHAA